MKERESHVINVLKAIRNVHRLIIKEQESRPLAKKICEELTATLGYFNAWIALLDKASGRVMRTASSGFNGGFGAMQVQLLADNFPLCMQQATGVEELIVIHHIATI